MSSLLWLGLAVFVVGGVALFGRGPKGGNPVARTRLMHAARYVLLLAAVAAGAVGLLGLFRG
jgi:hypothetical protein